MPSKTVTMHAEKPNPHTGHKASYHPIEDSLGIGRNKHVLVELAKASLALHHATRQDEREGMEELVVYLSLELEKRARYSHYYDELKAKHANWFTRIAGQFRIGARVAREINANRQSPAWIKGRVEFWVKKALDYHRFGQLPGHD